MTEGFPADKAYNVFLHDTGMAMKGAKPAPLPSEFDDRGYEHRVDATGQLVSIKLRFSIHEFTIGEWWGLGVVSADGSVQAWTRVIPFPLEDQDGPCRISLQMVNNYAFLITGEGFPPGEAVRYVSRSNGEVSKGSMPLGPEGIFLDVVRFPAGIDKPGGRHETFYTSSVCRVSLSYNWGTARRFQ